MIRIILISLIKIGFYDCHYNFLHIFSICQPYPFLQVFEVVCVWWLMFKVWLQVLLQFLIWGFEQVPVGKANCKYGHKFHKLVLSFTYVLDPNVIIRDSQTLPRKCSKFFNIAITGTGGIRNSFIVILVVAFYCVWMKIKIFFGFLKSA